VIILIVEMCAVRVNATDLEKASKLFFIFVEKQGLRDLFPSLQQMIYKLGLLYKTVGNFTIQSHEREFLMTFGPII